MGLVLNPNRVQHSHINTVIHIWDATCNSWNSPQSMFSHISPLGGSVKVLQNRSQFSQKWDPAINFTKPTWYCGCMEDSVRIYKATLGDSVSTSQEVTEARKKCRSGGKSCMCTVGSYTYVTLSNRDLCHTHASQINTRPWMLGFGRSSSNI